MSRVLSFVRGALAAGLVGALFLAVAVLVGATSQPSGRLFPAAAIAAVLFGFLPAGDRRYQLIGSAFAGLVAIASGIWSGFGAAEVAVVCGAVTGGILLWKQLGWPAWLPAGAVAIFVIGVVIANLVPLAIDGGGLGHDESAYALKARHWIEGTPETGWSLHRGIGMSAYGFLVFQAGAGDEVLRMLGVVAITWLAGATWLLGRRLGGRLVGPIAAIALMASPALLRRSTEYLSDVPAAGLLVTCMVILWHELADREAPTYRLLWIVPTALLAFYLRYQSALSFVLIAIAVLVLFWPKIKLHWRPVALTAGLAALGLIPHFLFAISETGSPMGILTFTADVSGREFYGEGLVDYVMLMAGPLAGYVGPLAAVFFIWWAVQSWKVDSQRVRVTYLAIPMIGQVVLLGIMSHGESRFVFFPLALLMVGGVSGFLWVSAKWRSEVARAISFGLVFVLVASLVLSVTHVRRSVANRELSIEPAVLAAYELRSMSGADECGVMTSLLPQITYYSECWTAQFTPSRGPEESLARLEGEDRYMVLTETGRRQPEGEYLSGLVALTAAGPIAVEGRRDSAEIYVFAP